MGWRIFGLLGLLGLVAALGVAAFQAAPGYMDAEYYSAGGQRLVQGNGFSEMLLWNYLDDPSGLPHPSHGYWMPLTSLLAALGMWILNSQQFEAARLGFLLLAVVVPVVTAALSYSLTRRRDLAWLAGLLAVFSAFYFPYIATTDSFGLYMLFGALFLLLLQAAERSVFWMRILPFGLGMIAGALHLSRADGIIWFLVALLIVVLQREGGSLDKVGLRWNPWVGRLSRLALCGMGYLLVMGPWMLRDLRVFGAPLSPGGSRALWFTDYDELYIYPASLLTLERWWNSGLGEILRQRAWALGLNLQTTLAVQGQVFILPLILAGLWKLRQQSGVRWGTLAWGLTLLVMTLVFPFAGARGGFFHSGAAVQPLFWAVAPLGLEMFVSWGSRLRHWNLVQARCTFQIGLVGLTIILTGFVFTNRVLGDQPADPAWNRGWQRYTRVEQRLPALGVLPGQVLMVNDPPGYFLASQRPAIVIPYGDLSTLLAVARRYQAHYLLVELDQVQGEELFAAPGDRPGLHYLESFEGMRIYRIWDGFP
jgi:hypothetical protein